MRVETPIRLPFLVEEWRTKDLLIALGGTEHPAVDGELGADPWAEMPDAPAGFSSLLAGWGLTTVSAEMGVEVQAPRRSRLQVSYTRRPAVRDQVMATIDTPDPGTIRVTTADLFGELVTVEQVLGDPNPLPAGSAAGGEELLVTRPLERVQLARWAYNACEMWPLYTNHVYATGTGRPAAVAPDTLALGLVELALTRRGVLAQVDAIELTTYAEAYAGETLRITMSEATGGAAQVWVQANGRITHGGKVRLR